MELLIPFLLNFVSQETLNYIAVGVTVLLVSSEALGFIPSLKANNNIQFVRDLLKEFLGLLLKKGGRVETLAVAEAKPFPGEPVAPVEGRTETTPNLNVEGQP